MDEAGRGAVFARGEELRRRGEDLRERSRALHARSDQLIELSHRWRAEAETCLWGVGRYHGPGLKLSQ